MNTSKLVLAVLAVLMAGTAAAGEMCEVMRKADGVLTSVQVPCSQVRRATTPEHEAALASDRQEAAARKRQCGKDFEALRVGMTLKRYEQCTGGLVFVTDTTSKEGVVKTYRSTFYLIDAKGGRVVSFTRLAN